MKHTHLLSILLLTTIITNCDGAGSSGDDGPSDKAKEGIASESQPGDPVSFTAKEDNKPSPEKLVELVKSLPDELKSFLITNHLEDKYFIYKQDFDALNSSIALFAPDGIKPAKSEVLDRNLQKVHTSTLELGTQFYKSREKEYKSFDFKGDIKTVKDWNDIKKLGSFVDYFDPWMLDQKVNKLYFPVSDRRLKSNSSSNTDDNILNYEALFSTEAEVLAYKALVADNDAAKESYAQVVSTREGTRESFSDLQAILGQGVLARVDDILLSSQKDLSLSKGVSVLNRAINALLSTDKYYIKTLTGEFKKSIAPLTMEQVDIVVFNEWRGIITYRCFYHGARSSPAGIYDHKLPDSFLIKGAHLNTIARRLNLISTVDDDALVSLIVDPYIGGGKVAFYQQTIKDGVQSNITTLDKELYDALIAEFEQTLVDYLKTVPEFAELFTPLVPITAAQLSADTPRDISSNVSLRQARTAATGSANLAGFKMNGVAGQSVELGLPLFVQLKGDVSSAKATEATTGSVAYRLGNTVIGAIQGYANSGAGFGTDSRQLETSVVASHSFGSFFIEGQIGSVSATEVHGSNWSGVRSQLTLGLDTAFVSPFVQLTHRQLDRSGLVDLNETTAYVGLDMEVAKLAADTYSVDTRLLGKAGYGSKAWTESAKDLGSTTGFTGSVEWSASLNLNSGVAFSSNLALDTTAVSSAGLTVSLDR